MNIDEFKTNTLSENNTNTGFISFNIKYAWKVQLFGLENQYVLQFAKGQKIPNWFWRKMQYLILGNKWEKL